VLWLLAFPSVTSSSCPWRRRPSSFAATPARTPGDGSEALAVNAGDQVVGGMFVGPEPFWSNSQPRVRLEGWRAGGSGDGGELLLELGAQESARALDQRLRHYCTRTACW
jgi:hypothetical protein